MHGARKVPSELCDDKRESVGKEGEVPKDGHVWELRACGERRAGTRRLITAGNSRGVDSRRGKGGREEYDGEETIRAHITGYRPMIYQVGALVTVSKEMQSISRLLESINLLNPSQQER